MTELIKRGNRVSIIADKPYKNNVVTNFKITENKTLRLLFESKELLKALRIFKELEMKTTNIKTIC